MITFLATLYIITISGLSLYGLLGLLTLFLYWRHRDETYPCPPQPKVYPAVTVQLPIYNERYVVQRLIEAAVSLDYPINKLEIQVVDDSTDDTSQKVAILVKQYQLAGFDICHITRNSRQGFKAGALAHAQQFANGEFIALFDADFRPEPHFLKQTIPHFLNDPKLGMVQSRWGHLNHTDSPLTAAQAIALDKHFALEQTVRHRANLFPKFNGAGGIWRRQCLDDAGGWQDDTVTEDLCLSTRAILKGWQFRFLLDIVSPAELPASISAYKNQQARWAKGSSQCLLKFSKPILQAKEQTLIARLYALLTMSAYSTHFLVLMLLLLQIPLMLLEFRFSAKMMLFSIAGIGQPILFVMAQQVLYGDWQRRLKHFPFMLLIAIGIGPSTLRAISEIFTQKSHRFIRTPKYGGKRPTEILNNVYQFSLDKIIFFEIVLCLYALAGVFIAIWSQNFGPLLFLLSCATGFGYVAYLTFVEQRR